MSEGLFQKAVTYLREVQEIALFATMADSRWYLEFGTSPLFFVILPFMGFLLTVTALINTYHFVKAPNKNLNQWLVLLASLTCAVLASVSLYGTALSVFLGFSFPAGSWFFFTSLIVAMTQQIIMFGLNLYRIYESLPGSSQRMHYLQAAFNNLFGLGLLSGALGAVVWVMLFPSVAPGLGIACAINAVAFTVLDILWRILPHPWKLSIKGFFRVGKPNIAQEPTAIQTQDLTPKAHNPQDINPNHHRLFTRFDYSTEVRKMDGESARNYLDKIIVDKIASYGSDSSTHDQKTQDKLSVLKHLSKVLKNSETITKADTLQLLKAHPLAFQSFLTEKGEVEQIVNAVLVLPSMPDMAATGIVKGL